MYIMKDCYCVDCNTHHEYPLLRGEDYPIHSRPASKPGPVYKIQCHLCQVKNLSKETRAMWDTIFQRILANAYRVMPKKKAGKRTS